MTRFAAALLLCCLACPPVPAQTASTPRPSAHARARAALALAAARPNASGGCPCHPPGPCGENCGCHYEECYFDGQPHERPAASAKTCRCSALCTCGCNEGLPCRCGAAPAVVPQTYYQPAVWQAPAYRVPIMSRGGSC